MLATTRGAIIRGTTENEFGDEVDAAAPVAGFDDFPLAIIERNRTVFDQAASSWRTVHYLTGRLPANVPVLPGDRIRDNATGVIYAIDEEITTRRSIAGRSSVSLGLRQPSA